MSVRKYRPYRITNTSEIPPAAYPKICLNFRCRRKPTIHLPRMSTASTRTRLMSIEESRCVKPVPMKLHVHMRSHTVVK